MNIILISLAVKIVLAALIPINADEAYYWVWSKHMQLSFYDHPPFVAWLFWLGQPLDSLGSLVRLPGVVMAHGTLYLWYLTLKPLLSAEQLKWWMLIAVTSPFLGIGSLFITPDIPLMFFWALSALALTKIFEDPNLKNFAFLGAALGLGFTSKYHTVFFIPLGLILVFLKHGFKSNLVKNILFSILIFFVFSAPVWIWNLQNDWISFRFQLNHGLGAKSWDFMWSLEYLFGQIFIITPFLLYQIFKNAKKRVWPNWVLVYALFPLAFFFYTSLKNKVEANWTSIAFPYLFIMAVMGAEKFKWIKASVWFWTGLFALVLVQLSFHPFSIPGEDFKTNELTKFKQVKERLKQSDLLEQPVFARTYQMASKLSFDLKKPIYKLKGLNRRDYFDEIPESIPQSSYYIVLKKEDSLPPWTASQGHKIIRTESIDPLFDLAYVEVP